MDGAGAAPACYHGALTKNEPNTEALHPKQHHNMTITKAELTQAIMDGVGLNQREAKDMVEAFFAEISICLSSGGEVKISGFGNFALRNKPARPGRNPKTGESIPVSARRVVTFHASSKLKAAVERQLKPMRVAV